MLDNKNLFRDLLFFVALVGLLRNLAKPEIVAQSSNTTFKPRRLSKRPAPKKALSTSTNKLNPDHKNKLSNKNLSFEKSRELNEYLQAFEKVFGLLEVRAAFIDDISLSPIRSAIFSPPEFPLWIFQIFPDPCNIPLQYLLLFS